MPLVSNRGSEAGGDVYLCSGQGSNYLGVIGALEEITTYAHGTKVSSSNRGSQPAL
jgi:hypothetical protein